MSDLDRIYCERHEGLFDLRFNLAKFVIVAMVRCVIPKNHWHKQKAIDAFAFLLEKE